MGNLWLKIKIWTKIGVLSLLVIYLMLFCFNNGNQPLSVWIWFGHDPDKHNTTVLQLILWMLVTGVVGTLLVRAAFSTIHQVRDLRDRNRSAQMEKDMTDLRAKATMLQTKPTNPPENP
jgi:lysylphosphatidylglycerol synthetase-like protein (DUF2156 family)